jgi:hypothetical protein
MEIGYSQLRGSSWELYFSLMERRWRWVRADLLVMGAYGHSKLREQRRRSHQRIDERVHTVAPSGPESLDLVPVQLRARVRRVVTGGQGHDEVSVAFQGPSEWCRIEVPEARSSRSSYDGARRKRLEISRQAELFPPSCFFQSSKVVLFCAVVRIAAE